MIGSIRSFQRPHEREDRERREGRLGQRQVDVAVDLPRVGAVDAGGVGELVRDRQEELAQQERPERAAEERPDPQRLLGPDPVAARAERGAAGSRYRMKFGTSTTWNGMIRVPAGARTAAPGTGTGSPRRRTPPSSSVISWPTVLSAASLSELRKNVPNAAARSTCPGSSPSGAPVGSERRRRPNTSARVLSDVEIIHRNGTIISSPPTISRRDEDRPTAGPDRAAPAGDRDAGSRNGAAASTLTGSAPSVAATGSR